MDLKVAFAIVLLSTGLVLATGLTLLLVDGGDPTHTKAQDADGWDEEDTLGFTVMMYGLIFGSPTLLCLGAAVMSAGVVNKQESLGGE